MQAIFLRCSAAVLVATSLAKLKAAAGASGALMESEPLLLGFSFASLLLFAAGLEFAVVAVCLFRPVVDGLVAIAWLSTVFLSYRVGLWWIGWKKPCTCLGNLTDALHISPQLADNVMKGLLAFMLIGSVSLLVAHYRQSRIESRLPETPQAATE